MSFTWERNGKQIWVNYEQSQEMSATNGSVLVCITVPSVLLILPKEICLVNIVMCVKEPRRGLDW
jgi:hypothetical protein